MNCLHFSTLPLQNQVPVARMIWVRVGTLNSVLLCCSIWWALYKLATWIWPRQVSFLGEIKLQSFVQFYHLSYTCWLPPASFLLWEGICFGSYLQSFLFLCTCCDNVLFSPILLPVVLFCVSYFVNPVLRPIFFSWIVSRLGDISPLWILFSPQSLFSDSKIFRTIKRRHLSPTIIYMFLHGRWWNHSCLSKTKNL